MEQLLKLNEFFVEGGDERASHVLLHISEPSTAAERKKGYFFAVCEINAAAPETIAEIQTLIDKIENHYYDLPDAAEKTSLELVLENINQESASGAGMDSVHCLVGAIRQTEIIFASHGRPLLWLFYKNRQGLYQTMNLLDGESAQSEQLFSHIVQGKLSGGDYLFVGTPQVEGHFDADRLQKIITTRSPRESAEHLERVLGELRGGVSFGGLIIHLLKTESLPKKIRPVAAPGASAASLKTLLSTEQRTASTLSPNMLSRAGEKVRTMFNNQANRGGDGATSIEREAEPEIGATHLYPHRSARPVGVAGGAGKLAVFGRLIWEGLKFIGRYLALFAIALWRIIYALLANLLLFGQYIFNYKNRRQSISDHWKREWRSRREALKQLPLVTKILIILSLLFVLIFAGSLWYLRAEQNRRAFEAAQQLALGRVRAKTDSAESQLIYKNEDAARRDLLEAKTILSSLSCTGVNKREECQNLSAQIEKLLVRIRRLDTVSPVLLADWTGAKTKKLAKINQQLFGISASSTALNRYDLLTKESARLNTLSTLPGFTGFAVPKENDYLLLLAGNRPIIFKPEDKSAAVAEISYPLDSTKITGAVIYNRRLYTVDAKNNQIYKHDPIKGGFTAGKPWLKNNDINLSGAGDIAIDGDLYILKNNGEILKFAAGAQEPFAPINLDPPLAGGERFWTYNDLNYLYVLDGAGKRLIILAKDGRLVSQLTAKEFVNPTGLAIDEPNRAAYILDSDKLYKIILP